MGAPRLLDKTSALSEVMHVPSLSFSIKSLPENFGNMRSDCIDLSGNQLISLPDTLFGNMTQKKTQVPSSRSKHVDPASITHRNTDSGDTHSGNGGVNHSPRQQPSVPNVGVPRVPSASTGLGSWGLPTTDIPNFTSSIPAVATSWVPSTTCGAREGEWSKKNPNTLQFKLNNLNETEENAPCGQKDSDYERDDDINPDDVSSDFAPEDYGDDSDNYGYGHDDEHTKIPRPGRGGGAYSNAMKAARYSTDAHMRVMSYVCQGMCIIVEP